MKTGAPRENPDGGIDAGLEALMTIARPGVPFTQKEIAFVCGCARQNVFHIGRRALLKIRRRLRKALNQGRWEFWEMCELERTR